MCVYVDTYVCVYVYVSKNGFLTYSSSIFSLVLDVKA